MIAININNTPIYPPLHEVLKHVRKQGRKSQGEIADKLYMSRSNYSCIETGKQLPSEEHYQAIKCILGADDIPFRISERPHYKSLLKVFYNLISERRLDTAKEIHKRLSNITLIPWETEYNTTFSLYECRYLLNLDKLDEANAILDSFAVDLDKLNPTQMYHYCYNRGLYDEKINSIDTALDFYNQASDLTPDGQKLSNNLCFNIFVCHNKLGYISKSLEYLHEAIEINATSQTKISEFHLYNALGANYILIGHLRGGRYELKKALLIADTEYNLNKNETTKKHMGMVLINHGYLYRTSKLYNRAIGVLNNAKKYLNKNDEYYFEVIYQIACCIIESDNLLNAIDTINEGIELSKGNEAYSLMFEALKIMASPDDISIERLSQEILPYFIENNHVGIVMDFAKFLRKYYKDNFRGNLKRALEMSEVCFVTQSKINEGGVIEWENDLLDFY